MKHSICIFAAVALTFIVAAASSVSAHGRSFPLPKDWRNVELHNRLHNEINNDIAELRAEYSSSSSSSSSSGKHHRLVPPTDAEVAAHLDVVKKRQQRLPLADPSGGFVCDICTGVVGKLLTELRNASAVPGVIAFIQKDVCMKLFNASLDQKLCKDVVPPLIKLVSKLDEKATKGGWNLPRIICADIAQSYTKCAYDCCTTKYNPEQIHLGFADTAEKADYSGKLQSYTVSWTTSQNVSSIFGKTTAMAQWRVVLPGSGNRTGPVHNESASQRNMAYSGFAGVIHGAILKDLPANSTIEYRVGGTASVWLKEESFFSSWIRFKTFRADIGTEQNPLHAAYIADMGLVSSGGTIKQLTKLVDDGEIHMLLWAGDILYADGDSSKFDAGLRIMQPIMSRLVVMWSCGNHESMWANATEYRHRFWQPVPEGVPEGALYYNVRIGPVHFTSLDTETVIDTPNIDARQVEWASGVLARANAYPGGFSYVQHHRPLYCNNAGKGGEDNDAACNGQAAILREQIEWQYVKNKVDAVFCGHVHSMEVTYPIDDGQQMGTSYDKPDAPVYVIDGSAGNVEGQAAFSKDPFPWSRFRTMQVGFQRLTFTQKKDSTDGKLHTSMKSVYYNSKTNTQMDTFTLVSKR